jgi:hypothetical protein
MTTIIWIATLITVLGSIELLARAATTEVATVTNTGDARVTR